VKIERGRDGMDHAAWMAKMKKIFKKLFEKCQGEDTIWEKQGIILKQETFKI
jgi:hypothetical protein